MNIVQKLITVEAAVTAEVMYARTRIAPEFDLEYYLTQVPGLRSHSADPIVHYLEQGWRELRDPSPHFSTSFYLDNNPDVRQTGINPFFHYVVAGRSEGRFGRPEDPAKLASGIEFELKQIASEFDDEYYLQQAPELRGERVEPLRHYIEKGWRELLDPSPQFSTSLYLTNYPDVQASGINPLFHYLVAGRAERRRVYRSEKQFKEKKVDAEPALNANAGESRAPASELPAEVIDALRDPQLFDIDFYRKNRDLAGNDIDAVIEFLTGSSERASPYFDPAWYRQQHPEIGDQKFAPLCHYIRNGREKGFRPSPIFTGNAIEMAQGEIEKIIDGSGLFDAAWYAHQNSDVVRAGADPLKHYARVGHREYKRTPNALFDNTYYLKQAMEVREYQWNPLVHYMLVGSKKALSTHVLFDVRWFDAVQARRENEEPPLAWLFKKAIPEGIGPNAFFDPGYYGAHHAAALEYPGGMLAHFLEVGWREGFDPSERFSTRGYLDANPDVRERGMNPLFHFMSAGRAEGRNPKPTPASVPVTFERFSAPEYGAVGPEIRFDQDVTLPANFALSIAVHLHLYYTEMAEEFCRYLSNIPTPFHLFVSVPPGRGDPEEVRATFVAGLRNCNGVTVACPENRGRDVAPFLVEFGRKLLAYDLVLHLHSKRSPHSPKHAGWRRYLLHYTLGNRAVVTQILTAFYADPNVGVFQPPYHPEVRAQPKWGGNRNKIANQLHRFGLSYLGDTCPDFPAGSFFWARTDAIRPLLEGRLAVEDFDEEAGQVDGTLAHALERLLGLVPVLRGYSVICRFIDVAHDLVNYYGKSRAFSAFDRDRTADILAYQAEVRARAGKRGRIAVVTAISGPFDALLLPYQLEPSVDYFCVTDSVSDGYGVFRLLPCPYVDADPRRSARYIKTNLLRLFPGYDFIVWVDANVLIRGKVSDLVAATEASGRPIGAIPHPIRRSYLEEAAIAIEMKLDDVDVIDAQMKAYESIEGLDQSNLIETNFMVFDARDPRSKQFTQLWWNEINTRSRRDQLSVNYCLAKTQTDWHPLLPEYMSVRDSEHFSLFRHELNKWGPKPHVYAAWHKPNAHDGRLLPLPNDHRWARYSGRLDLDVVICVHNALDDVKACLASVEAALDGRGALILVDDASDRETANFLADYAAGKGATLVRHEQSKGYTKAANAGVRVGTNRNVLLLNSDTIVPRGAFDKMSDALDRDALLGIVGPLSNAASAQSVPSTTGTASQTAINKMPPGMTVADMDLLFERRWDGAIIRTPLVHGFCFCVKRAVFEAVGLFDEENFPRGYGEENDFCFRAADAGFDLGVLANTYIFHAKSKSYREEERTQLMNEGMEALVRKHTKRRISRAVATINGQPGLARAREAVAPLFEATAAVPRQPRGRLFLVPALRSDGLPAGSGYVRVLLPYRTAAVCRDWEVNELRTSKLPILGPTDVVLVQRDAAVIGSEDLTGWISNVRKSGARLVYEVDDDLLDGQALRKRGFRGDAADLTNRVLALTLAADCVTVSSDALHKKFATLNRNVVFVPNALDVDLWRLDEDAPPALLNVENRQHNGRITIGYVGTPTHDEDLALVDGAIAELRELFPGRIDVQVIGGFGQGKEAFGSVIPLPLANDYPSFVRWLRATVRWDIGLVPLAGSRFNANKSYLKFLECGALGMAMVCSQGPEYAKVVRHGENGLLVENTQRAWTSALSDLIRKPADRIGVARAAYESIRTEHSLNCTATTLLDVLSGKQGEPPATRA
jgi:GT2 family glycosyltransferase/glycosyltransferase involved in cell wall biosynthesis